MIKRYSITWSYKAYKDLNNIESYLRFNLNEFNIARKNVNKILSCISNLTYLPEKNTRLYNYYTNVRKMKVNKYIIIYEVDNDKKNILILRIFHGSQNYFNKL